MDSQVVAQLVGLANISELQAKQLLEATGGNLDAAVELALEQTSASAPTVPGNPVTNSAPKPQVQPQPRKGGIVGFGDLGGKQEESDGKKDLNWFTGGHSSGIQVQAPKQPQPTQDVFDQAVKHGAIAKHDEKAPEKEKFGGSGFVLGNTENQSAVVAGAAPKPHTSCGFNSLQRLLHNRRSTTKKTN